MLRNTLSSALGLGRLSAAPVTIPVRFQRRRVVQPMAPPIQVDPSQYVSPEHPDAVFPPLSSFRTTESDPAKLNQSHLGRFYSVDKELYKNVLKPVQAF